MYRPPVDRLERLLPWVAFVVALVTLLYIAVHWARAEEPGLFAVDVAEIEASSIVLSDDAKDTDILPLFPQGRPVVGQCYGLKAVQTHKAVGLVYVPQPCFFPAISGVNSGISIEASSTRHTIACLAGWCITRVEQP